MLKSDLHPEDIYEQREVMGLDNSVNLLINIIENDENSTNRKDAVKYLGKITPRSKKLQDDCYETLENVLISDSNSEIKCEAAKCLGKLKDKKALKPLKWLISQEKTDSQLKIGALESISNIRFEKEEIKLFIKELNCTSPSIQEFLKNKLTSIGPEKILPLLLDSIDGENFTEDHKTNILKIIGSELSSINLTFEGSSFIKSTYPEIQSSLIKNKGALCKTITHNLKEEDTELINSSITILEMIKQEITVDLKKLMSADDFIVNKNAIVLIGKLKIKEKSIINGLLKDLDDIYSEVSKAAIEALGEIAVIETVPDLLKAIDIEDVDYEYIDLDFKWFILDAVKKIYLRSKGAPYTLLYDCLEGKNEILKESSAFIMGEIGNEEFLDPLINLLNEKNLDLRKNAIIALGKIGKRNAILPLIRLLDNGYTYWLLKKVAVDALYNIYHRNFDKLRKKDTDEGRSLARSVQKLIDYLDENESECFKVKLSIIKFLEVFGDQLAIKALIRRVNDFNRLVRISASKAIKRIEERLEKNEHDVEN